MFKKIVSLLLVAVILATSLGISVSADVGIDPEIYNVLARLDPDAQPFLVQGISALASLGSFASAAMGAYSAVTSVLKMLGVMSDPEQEFRVSVISKLNDIISSTNQINSNLNALTADIQREFSALNMRIDESQIIAYNQNISDFEANYERPLRDTLNAIGTTVSDKYVIWFDEGSGKLADGSPDRGFDAALHLIPTGTKIDADKLTEEEKEKLARTDAVHIDGALFNAAVVQVEGSDVKFAEIRDRFTQEMEKILGAYFDTFYEQLTANRGRIPQDSPYRQSGLGNWYADFMKANYGTPYSIRDNYTWLSIVFADNSINARLLNYRRTLRNNTPKARAAFIAGAENALINRFLTEIAKDRQGSSSLDSNIVRFCNEFRNYCENVAKTSNNQSPLYNQLMIFSKIYNFQSEAIENINNVRDYYIGNLSRYAETYLYLMNLADISSYNDYVQYYANAVNALNRIAESFIVKDAAGNPIPNYSYQVGAPIEIKKVTLSQKMTIVDQKWENNFGGTYDAYMGSSGEDWKLDVPGGDIVGNSELLKVFAMYKHLDKSGAGFSSYLSAKANGNSEFASVGSVLTSPIEKLSFSLNDKIKMKFDASFFRSEFLSKNSDYVVNCGKTENGTSVGDDEFPLYDGVAANTFNMKSGAVAVRSPLQYRAILAKNKGSVQKDRIAFLFTGTRRGATQTSKAKDDVHTNYTTTLETADSYYVVSVTNPAPSLNSSACNFSLNNIADDMEELDIKATYSNCLQDRGDKAAYNIAFDEEKYFTGEEEIDNEIQQKFIDYASEPEVIRMMEEDYYRRLDELCENLLLEDSGIVEVETDRETVEKIVNALVGQYVPDPEHAEMDGGAYVIDGKEGKYYIPTAGIADLKFAYVLTYIPLYMLDCENGEYRYEMKDILNITPILLWDNGDRYAEVDEAILKELGLTFTIRIPIIGETDKEFAEVIQFYNLDMSDAPIGVLRTRVVGEGDDQFLELEVDNFAFLSITELVACTHEDEDGNHICDLCGKDYTNPNTGASVGFTVFVIPSAAAALALAVLLILKKRRAAK